MQVTRPIWILAALAALTIALTGCDRKITAVEETSQAQSCFACHSDANTVLVDAEQQWDHSRHASGSTLNENDSTCKGCHTSEGFIARATGVTGPDAIDEPDRDPLLHLPRAAHERGLPAALDHSRDARWTARPTTWAPATSAWPATSRGATSAPTWPAARRLTNRWGPHHGPQGDMLLGSNGYEYAGYTYERTTHREATEDGCLDCHFKATSQYVVGGHSFNMEGMTSSGEEVLNTGACTPCHGPVSDFNVGGVQDSVDVLHRGPRRRAS